LIANLNGFKREFAFLAASIVVILRGTGNAYTPQDLINRINYAFGRPPQSCSQISTLVQSKRTAKLECHSSLATNT